MYLWTDTQKMWVLNTDTHMFSVSVSRARRGSAESAVSETAATRFITESCKIYLLFCYIIILCCIRLNSARSVHSDLLILTRGSILLGSQQMSDAGIVHQHIITFHMRISHFLCGFILGQQQTELECFIC